MKLFGGTSGARTAGSRSASGTKTRRKRNPFKALAIFLALILFCEGCYFFVIFTKNSFISYWRDAYIETAMDTLNHKWLATAIFPKSLIDEVVGRRAQALESQIDLESTWGSAETPSESPVSPEEDPIDTDVPEQVEMDTTVLPEVDPEDAAKEAFFIPYQSVFFH